MAEQENQYSDIRLFNRGLQKDTSHQIQPEGSYSFALNATNRDLEGENGENLITESAIQEIIDLEDYIVINKIYMGNGRFALLSSHVEENISEIGIFYTDSNKYETIVNDANSIPKDKLNFSVGEQIFGTYRLRRGCQDVIYWVSRNEKPRTFNFSAPHKFKNQVGNWVASKFNLQKISKTIPEFRNVEVIESGGNLEPGSYNFSVELLDESFNSTGVLNVSPTVKIYNDSESKEYRSIKGSTKSKEEFENFPNTLKSIKITLDNLDEDFFYYRVGIICANSGSGEITKVLFSDPKNISDPIIYATGENFNTVGSEEDIKKIQDVIEGALAIEQLENRLLIGNTKGAEIPYCDFQSYASQIQSDCVVKEVNLTSIEDKANQKNSVHEFNDGVFYSPGELYSFGIVYILEGFLETPAYHIPGRNKLDEGIVFSPQVDDDGNNIVFPMSINNTQEYNYTDSNSCENGNYWGVDSRGEPLVGKKVRHHRFPFRNEILVPRVRSLKNRPLITSFYTLHLGISGELKIPKDCPSNDPNCGTDEFIIFKIRVKYQNSGENFSFSVTIDPRTYADNQNLTYQLDLDQGFENHQINDFQNIELEVTDGDGEYHSINSTEGIVALSNYFLGTVDINTNINEFKHTSQKEDFKTKGFGIKFSNIKKPPAVNGREVIGYYIVRHKREERDKSILDSGVAFQTMKTDKYLSYGLLNPDIQAPTHIRKKDRYVFGVVHPEHLFNGKELTNFDRIRIDGVLLKDEVHYSKISFNDVMDGTTFDAKGEKHHKRQDDGPKFRYRDFNMRNKIVGGDGEPDGWSIDIAVRSNVFRHSTLKGMITVPKEAIVETFYLDALDNKDLKEIGLPIFNVSSDNKICIINVKKEFVKNSVMDRDDIHTVIFERDNFSAYSDFRVRPYYKESANPRYFGNENNVISSYFNGDTYISPMTYGNSIFWDNRPAVREQRSNVWKYIAGAVIVVIGIVASIFSFGAASPLIVLGAGLIAAGAGTLLISSGIKQANYFRTYLLEYENGLKNTVLDDFVDIMYKVNVGDPSPTDPYRNETFDNDTYISGTTYPRPKPIKLEYEAGKDSFDHGWGQNGPSDDTIRWIYDVFLNLWFESSVNINLRNRFYDEKLPNFIEAPSKIESGNTKGLIIRKIGNFSYQISVSRYPVSEVERHITQKLLTIDNERDDNLAYIGFALGDYYNVNKDYERRERQRPYFHLAIEYDCCSNCNEKHPHRIYYSEQSYQEELSDNYGVFLPNNYRDIEGETGEIKALVSFLRRLFVITEDSVWLLPSNHQERVTGDLVSFIGTGDFFSVPPQRIVEESSGNSSGTQHSMSILKTPIGVLFSNANQGKIYLLDGQNIHDITLAGLSQWGKKNLKVRFDEDYAIINKKKYNFSDNPVNPVGTGFVMGYDSLLERVLITKIDRKVLNNVEEKFEICIKDNGEIVVFNNPQETIDQHRNLGWEYVGIENCRMKFRKQNITQTEVGNVEFNPGGISRDSRIFISIPSGNFGTESAIEISAMMIRNTLYRTASSLLLPLDHDIQIIEDSGSENWITSSLNVIKGSLGGNLSQEDIILISIVENNTSYIGDQGDILSPTDSLVSDKEYFKDEFLNEVNSFTGILVPIFEQKDKESNNDLEETFFNIGAILGEGATKEEFYNLLGSRLDYIDPQTLEHMENLIVGNSVFGDSLLDAGFTIAPGTSYTYINDDDNGESIIDFGGRTSIDNPSNNPFTSPTRGGKNNPIYKPIVDEVYEYLYVSGEPYIEGESYNNSVTLSFDLLNKFWVSFHSYFPRLYLSGPNKLYSTYLEKVDDPLRKTYYINGISKHNITGKYSKYNDTFLPFVVEYSSNKAPFITKIYDFIQFQTEAKKYDFDNEYFNEVRFKTFNKVLFYNSRQTSGVLNILVKDELGDDIDYLLNQVKDLGGDSIIVDKNEKDWTLNELRDYRIDYSKPMFKTKLEDIQNEYYIDKIIDTSVIDYDKDWTSLESFRDKYLTIRFIFDNFEDIKLMLNYTIENKVQSFR